MSDNADGKSPAVAVAKTHILEDENGEVIVTLSTGARARLAPVSPSLIAEAGMLVKDPEVPIIANPDKDGRLESNPSDPKYLAAMQDANLKRNMAGMDVTIMLGIDLLDDTWKTDTSWLKRLRVLEKLGQLDLRAYDLDDETELEFVFKKYVAADATIISMLSEMSGVSADAVSRAERLFRRKARR